MEQFEIINNINFKIISKGSGYYDFYSEHGGYWNLNYENVNSNHETWNDDLVEIIKWIKLNHIKEKQVKAKEVDSLLNSNGLDLNLGKVLYSFRIYNATLIKLRSIKINSGINTNEFINRAIIEKLERDNLLT